MQPSQATWGASNKTLADYVKESAWHSSASSSASLNTTNHNATTSMPWVAAVKSPPDHHAAATAAAVAAASSYDYQSGGAIGSWSSPETDNSRSRGWNADGSSKSDGVLDDGTAIWGNPITKKTGVDWTDKEATMNPPHAQKICNNSDAKRIQKPEPIISSINGTEAWGAPLNRGPLNSNSSSSSSSQHQQQPKIDNGGNTYGVKSNDSLAWGESTTSKSSSSSLQQATLEKSSPPNTSVWNNMGISSKQKSSDWLSSSSNVIGSANSSNASLRLSELDKQLEATGLFDSMSKNASCNNPNLEQRPIGVNLECSNGSGGENSIGVGGSVMNDLKQMSANYPNDLLDSPIRQPNSSSTNANQQSQALDSTAFSAATSPSRDLLKQMVHQIQLAVQAGHLNAHILNQPMSTPTLQLVYQLLQHIKTLHQLLEIQQRAGMKPDMSSPSNLDMQINRIRQNISSLQKAITHQQAALTQNETPIGDSNMKQQQRQQQQATHSYATISKLSTNMKVPPNNMANMNNSSNIESFRRSSFIDTSSNSNSDPLRSAQATFDANATSDKTLSSLVQASSANIILGNSNAIDTGDFTKAQCFTSGNINQQQSGLKGLLSAQSSSSSTAWSAFSSGDFNSPQGGWPSQSRISSNASRSDQPHQFSAFDMMQEFGAGKPWRGSPILLQDDKRTSVEGPSTMMPRAANGNVSSIARPNSASNTFKQMNENDIMNNRDSSLFCDWGNNGGGQSKRDFDPISTGAPSYSTPPIGSGLSLQSNRWMFGSDTSALGQGGDKLNNDNSEKSFGDSLFLKSSNSVADQQGSSSALYDWSDIASATPQLVSEAAGKQQFGNYSGSIGKGRPAPPPGLMSNIGPLMGTSASSNGISMLDSKSGGSANEAIGSGLMQSRESSSSLWSGAWFD